ncbi:protocadherin alpha-8-like [Rhinatrema bivittatum]|uniref:protocadherin alpha-8-like n=1 Tax=Rhinatrema bivittatum TaxID=194408 RepID=UPI00112C9044|nr:protocadherin alpha-8-like [Rhinatrema bivittatum]
MAKSRKPFIWKWQLQCLLFPSLWNLILGQIRYSILEEMDRGTFVGNIAKDLGLDISHLGSRRLRTVSEIKKQYFQVNMSNGFLFINEKIDRDEICAQISTCKVNLELVIDNPLEMHRLEIEIVDVNDNSPYFYENKMWFNISESASPGTRFPLQNAQDPDFGTNSVETYKLSPNLNFELNVATNSDNDKFGELVLRKALDREDRAVHEFILTAFDGGDPKRSGATRIIVNVIDANDNIPTFNQMVYKVKLWENAPKGTTVIHLNATDIDEGPNGEVNYYFSKLVPTNVRDIFSIEQRTGVITVHGKVDFEDTRVFEIAVEALDQGLFSVAGLCKVVVEIIDVNDNAPEVSITSISSPVREDAKPGTVIALIIISDKDSGDNGKVSCSLPSVFPFSLQNTFNNHYSLILKETLDRETTNEYNISISATDEGSPALSTTTTITITVSDVNDNRPRFTKSSYAIFVMENNLPGSLIFTISASDSDLKENGSVSYSLLSLSVSHDGCVSINSETGKVYALKSYDYEETNYLEFQVLAKDAGVPSLSNNISVGIFILDQNDNPPMILTSPRRKDSSATGSVPRTAEAGYFVSKVRAMDLDSGYNAWLVYHFLQSKESSLFKVGQYTGEVRTARSIRENDGTYHSLVVLVKDHGEPVLTSTVTLSITITEGGDAMPTELKRHSESEHPISDVNLYLVISIALISFIFLLTVTVLVAVRVYQANNNLTVCTRPPYSNNGNNCYYTQNNSYKVCLRTEAFKNNFTCDFRHTSENIAEKENELSEEGKRQQNINNLLILEENKPAKFSSDNIKTTFIRSLLDGKAPAWAFPLWEHGGRIT